MAFKRFRAGECPICKERTDCRINLDTEIIHCRADVKSVPGFSYIKEDAQGFNMWVAAETDTRKTRSKATPNKSAAQRTEAKTHREWELSRQLEPRERDQAWRHILLELKLTDSEDLIRRGLNLKQIEKYRFKSVETRQQLLSAANPNLAGVSADGKYLEVAAGILCPIYNVKREIVGAQNKVVDSTTGKYKWVTSYDRGDQITPRPHLPNGELPITIIQEGKAVGLCEGILKPVVAATRHGITLIGAAGGNFASSPQQLIETLTALSPDIVTIYPDGGSFTNRQVFQTTLKTIDLIKGAGFKIQIADWGHLLDKYAPDVDELSGLEGLAYLQPDEFRYLTLESYLDKIAVRRKMFKAIAQSDLSIASYGIPSIFEAAVKQQVTDKKKFKLLLPAKVTATGLGAVGSGRAAHEAKDGNDVLQATREAGRLGYRNVFWHLPTGFGKSHIAGRSTANSLVYASDDKPLRLLYLTQSPRNPTVASLEDNFVEFPVRNQGFHEDPVRKTPSGRPFRTHPKAGYRPAGSGNCHWSDKFVALRELNNDAPLCRKCPFFSKCKQESGEGYGYLHEAKEAATATQIRMHPSAVPDSLIDDHTVVFVDEYAQTLDFVKTTQVNSNDVDAIRNLIEALCPELSTSIRKHLSDLSFLISGLSVLPRFGMDTQAIKTQLGALDENVAAQLEILQGKLNTWHDQENEAVLRTKYLSELMRSLLTKNWVVQYLSIYLGLVPGSLHLSRESLLVSTRNDRLLDLLSNAKMVIFADATGHSQDLAMKLGVSANEIATITAEGSEQSSLKVVHIAGAGSMSKYRKSYEDKKRDLIWTTLCTEYGADNMGAIDFSTKAKHDWLRHFVDARGSNAYAHKKAVVAFGCPTPSLSGLQTEMQVYTGREIDLTDSADIEFKQFVGLRTSAELIQEIGRLRANRRSDEKLTFYFVGEADLTFLRDMGYAVTEQHVRDITPDAATYADRARLTLLEAYKQLKAQSATEPTIIEMAEYLGRTKGAISHIAKPYGGFAALKNIFAALLDLEAVVGESNEEIRGLQQNYLLNAEATPEWIEDFSHRIVEVDSPVKAALQSANRVTVERLLNTLVSQLDPTYSGYLANKIKAVL